MSKDMSRAIAHTKSFSQLDRCTWGFERHSRAEMSA